MAEIIPSMIDGLTEHERLVVWTALEHSSVDVNFEAFDLALAAARSNHVCPLDIQKSAIVKLAQNFVGTNNLNLLEPIGDVGNRYKGTSEYGIDTTGLEVRLNPVTRLLFLEDDDAVALQKLEGCSSCGESPICLLPVIPLVLVNGCDGGGPLLNSYIPKYKPEDIIANVRRFFSKKKLVPMIPWFRDFKGRVEPSPADITEFIVSGVLAQIDDSRRTVVIAELPIGKGTHDYITWLEGQPWYQCHKDLSVCSGSVQIEVTLFNDAWIADEEYLMKTLELKKTISVRDMLVLHPSGEFLKYENPLHIIADFIEYRSFFYLKRRDLLVANGKSALMSIESDIDKGTGVACRSSYTVKHWIFKLKPGPAASELIELLPTVCDAMKMIDNDHFGFREVAIAAWKILQKVSSLQESKSKWTEKQLSTDDLVGLQTVSNALKKVSAALSELEKLTIKRRALKLRLDQLEKEDAYVEWSHDLDNLELFLKERQGEVEEIPIKTKTAMPRTSRGKKRKAGN